MVGERKSYAAAVNRPTTDAINYPVYGVFTGETEMVDVARLHRLCDPKKQKKM